MGLDVHLLADNTNMKLIYASIAAKFSRHFVIWQPFWIFIIKIICQWSGNVFQHSWCPITPKSNFKSLKSDFYEQKYETF